jgi:uncharacterized protein YvpB
MSETSPYRANITADRMHRAAQAARRAQTTPPSPRSSLKRGGASPLSPSCAAATPCTTYPSFLQSAFSAIAHTRLKYLIAAAAALFLISLAIVPNFVDTATAHADSSASAEATAETEGSSTAVSLPTSVKALSVSWINQTTSLPTGCEITAATMMLDYYGFNARNTELNAYLAQSGASHSYIVDGVDYGTDPNVCFVGSTYSDYGWFCYTQPIVNALDGYLETQGSSLRAVDMTGSSIEEVYAQVAAGNPVTVWATIGMEERTVTDSWYTADGELISAATNDHAVTLLGYTAKTVTVADPIAGITTYSRSDFESAYLERGQMAVMLQNA